MATIRANITGRRGRDDSTDHPANGLLRLKAVLDLLQISKSTFYQGISEGRFPPSVRLGRRISRWRAADVFRLVEKGVELPDDEGRS